MTGLHQIGAYSKVDRDPRGHTFTVAYLAIIDRPLPVIGQDDAAKATRRSSTRQRCVCSRSMLPVTKQMPS